MAPTKDSIIARILGKAPVGADTYDKDQFIILGEALKKLTWDELIALEYTLQFNWKQKEKVHPGFAKRVRAP